MHQVAGPSLYLSLYLWGGAGLLRDHTDGAVVLSRSTPFTAVRSGPGHVRSCHAGCSRRSPEEAWLLWQTYTPLGQPGPGSSGARDEMERGPQGR